MAVGCLSYNSPSNMSTMRKKAREKEDFPLPVRPQMPIWKEKSSHTVGTGAAGSCEGWLWAVRVWECLFSQGWSRVWACFLQWLQRGLRLAWLHVGVAGTGPQGSWRPWGRSQWGVAGGHRGG